MLLVLVLCANTKMFPNVKVDKTEFQDRATYFLSLTVPLPSFQSFFCVITLPD